MLERSCLKRLCRSDQMGPLTQARGGLGMLIGYISNHAHPKASCGLPIRCVSKCVHLMCCLRLCRTAKSTLQKDPYLFGGLSTCSMPSSLHLGVLPPGPLGRPGLIAACTRDGAYGLLEAALLERTVSDHSWTAASCGPLIPPCMP